MYVYVVTVIAKTEIIVISRNYCSLLTRLVFFAI